MKAEDIMLGDWLSHGNIPCRIEYITKKKIGYLVKDKNRYRHDIPARFTPIPITEEILERNRFLKRGDHFTYRNQDLVLEIKRIDNRWKIEVFGYECGTYFKRYVHELSHVLRVLSIKKKIELW